MKDSGAASRRRTPACCSTTSALINASKAALGIAPENLNVLKTKDNDYGIARLDHELRAHTQLWHCATTSRTPAI